PRTTSTMSTALNQVSSGQGRMPWSAYRRRRRLGWRPGVLFESCLLEMSSSVAVSSASASSGRRVASSGQGRPEAYPRVRVQRTLDSATSNRAEPRPGGTIWIMERIELGSRSSDPAFVGREQELDDGLR